MFAMGLLISAVMFLCFVKQLGKLRNISRRFPFAAGKARRDFLEQPLVPVRIFKRGERCIRSAFWFWPANSRSKQSIKMKNLRHVDAAADEISTRFLDVGHNKINIPQRTGRR